MKMLISWAKAIVATSAPIDLAPSNMSSHRQYISEKSKTKR